MQERISLKGNDGGSENVEMALDVTLNDLQTDHIDLYLV